MSYLIDCALIGLVNYSKQQAVIVDQCSYPWTTGDGRTRHTSAGSATLLGFLAVATLAMLARARPEAKRRPWLARSLPVMEGELKMVYTRLLN